jgi:hypothetical protein
MIGQDRQAASNQHRNKKEIEEVAVTHPQRKAMRAGEVVGRYLWDRRNMWEAHKKNFDPRGQHRDCHQHSDSDKNRGAYPDTQATIGGIVNGGVCRIKRDHCMCPETLSRIGVIWRW